MRGRESEIELVRAQLESRRAPIMTVWGLGGVGKTYVALEAAYQSLASGIYPGGIWFLPATGEPREALARLATDLRVAGPPAVREALGQVLRSDLSLNDRARAVQLTLQNAAERSLLVLDAIDQQGWRAWLPSGTVSVLATSLDRRDGVGELLGLQPFNPVHAIALADALAPTPASANERAARDRVVSEQLGGLAIAVTVAARATAEWGWSWADYEERLNTQETALLDEPSLRAEYPRGVFAAIDLSLDRARLDAAATRVLDTLAVFAPNAVPFDWLAGAADIELGSVDAARTFAMLDGIGLSATDARAQTITVHQLVHRRLVARMSAEARLSVAARATSVVVAWLSDSVGADTIEVVNSRVPHLECLFAAGTGGAPSFDRVLLANRWARHLQYRGDYAAAREIFEEALASAKALEPAAGPVTSLCTLNLGLVLQDLGDHVTAEALVRESGEIEQRLSGGLATPATAAKLSCLASIRMHGTRDFAAAKSMLTEALAIDEEALGPDHPILVDLLVKLAESEIGLGDLPAARVTIERAVSIARTSGVDESRRAHVLTMLAAVREQAGDLDGLAAIYAEVVAIDEDLYGADHPATSSARNNLALCLHKTGDFAGAREQFERSLADVTARLGPDHPDRSNALGNYGALLLDLDEVSAAEPILREAVRVAEKSLGPSNGQTAMAYAHLANLLDLKGDHEQALKLRQRCVDIDSKLHGDQHFLVARSLSNLAVSLMHLKRHHEALIAVERAHAIDVDTFGETHPEVAIRLCNAAAILADLGRHRDAVQRLSRAAAIERATYGSGHHETCETLGYLAAAAFRAGELEQGCDALEEIADAKSTDREGVQRAIAGGLDSLLRALTAARPPGNAGLAFGRARRVAVKMLHADHPILNLLAAYASRPRRERRKRR